MSAQEKLSSRVKEGTLEDSDMKGVSSLLKMREGWREVVIEGSGDGARGKDKADGLGFVLRGIDMNEANGDGKRVLDGDLKDAKDGVRNREEGNKVGSNGEVLGADGNGSIENEREPHGKEPGKAIENKDEDFGDEGGHEYSVGDFVWGKIKSHPWWPGQIYDASDASDYALKLKQDGKLLVAYFGDGTFAWCYPSQLRPFNEKFEEMAQQSSSRNFVNAVEAAVAEIERIVDFKITCACVPAEKRSGVNRPVVVNGGIKDNVLVPDMGIEKLSLSWIHQPVDLFTNLKVKARAPCDSTLLENVMLKSWMSAYYRSKGIYHLPVYSEPQLIEGLEDQKEVDQENGVMGKILSRGPMEEEWLPSSSPKPATGKSRGVLGNGSPQKRKQKSIAEILEGEKSKEVAVPKKPGRKRRRVANLIESSPITESGDSGIEMNDSGRGKEVSKERGRKKKRIGPVKDGEESETRVEASDTEAKDSSGKGYISRERKKSKYLCPPYTNPSRVEKKIDIVSESLKVSGTSSLDGSGEMSPKPEVGFKQEKASAEMPKLDEKESTDPVKVEASAKDVLSEIQILGMDPSFSKKTESFPAVEEFLHDFRSSVYSDYRNSNLNSKAPESGKKRRRESTDPSVKERIHKDESTPVAKIQSGKAKKSGGTERKVEKSGEAEMDAANVTSETKPRKKKIKKSDKSDTGAFEIKPCGSSDEKKDTPTPKSESKKMADLGARLLVSFGPGSSLPSKEDLTNIYSRFGPLNESETNMYYNNFCGVVAFERTSDAESALTSSQNSSPFESANVTFVLRRLSPKKSSSQPAKVQSKTPKKKKPVDEDRTSEIEFLKKKLESMSSLLEKSDGKLSKKARSKLEGELKGVLEKVSSPAAAAGVGSSST